MAVKAVMAAWFKVADQRAVRAAATLCWRVAGACLVRALAKPSMKVAASSLQLPSFSIVSASTLRRWLLSRYVLFCFCVHLHTRPLRSFPWVGFLWWVWMASNWQSRWQWPRRCSMTSTERLPAVESFTLKTSTMFQCFAAQDTSLERSVVAKAESCQRNVFPFHVSFYWSRATVPNHRVERIQCQTIASWRKPLWYRNFVTDSWDFHGKTKTKHDCIHRWCKVRITWLSKSWFGFSPHRRCACVLMFSVPCPSTKRALSLNPASGPQCPFEYLWMEVCRWNWPDNFAQTCFVPVPPISMSVLGRATVSSVLCNVAGLMQFVWFVSWSLSLLVCPLW